MLSGQASWCLPSLSEGFGAAPPLDGDVGTPTVLADASSRPARLGATPPLPSVPGDSGDLARRMVEALKPEAKRRVRELGPVSRIQFT